MTEFFIYCKEVLNIVSLERSRSTDNFIRVITANDLKGISLTGDATFRKALSASSKQATELVSISNFRRHNRRTLSKHEMICVVPCIIWPDSPTKPPHFTGSDSEIVYSFISKKGAGEASLRTRTFECG